MMIMMPFPSFRRWHRRLYAGVEINGVSKSGALLQKVRQNDYSGTLWFFRNNPYQLLESISFAANNSLPQRPYIVRFIIFNLLFVPSTKPLDKGLATAFSTADKSFSSPEAKRGSFFKSLFLYFSINRYKHGMFFF